MFQASGGGATSSLEKEERGGDTALAEGTVRDPGKWLG